MRALRRSVGATLAGLVVGSAVLAGPPSGAADDDNATIAHVESTGEELRVLVNVPAGSDVDLSGVTGTLDGIPLATTAVPSGTDDTIERTTVLAIDTSDSMERFGRFEAAKGAAETFLEAVPGDVRVGIVTFDQDVEVALEPTTDRSEASEVIEALDLDSGTRLYDGVSEAIDVSGTDGQRNVLVLSDGADTGQGMTLDDVVAKIEDTDTRVDVVSLDRRSPPQARQALVALAAAGNGDVIEATSDDLGTTFAELAERLASQIAVTAPVPEGFHAPEATVAITLPTSDGDLVASAYVPIQDAPDSVAPLPPPTDPDGWLAPSWVLVLGLATFAVGLLILAWLLVPRPAQPMTVAERLDSYTGRSGARATPVEQRPVSEPVLDQAKAAAAGVLSRNRGLDERMTRSLVAAGSGLRSSEWLLLHVAIVVLAVLVGLLAGSGNVIVTGLFLLAGIFLPRLYLAFRAGRRRRAFHTVLPDALQLMSGALAAGLSLPQAVDTVSREGQEPVASEFKRVLVENRIGVPLEDAFVGVADRFASKDFAWVVTAIRIQRQVGGNLAELLTTVANTMREREYLRRQVSSLSAEGRLSAWILCILPPGIFAFVLLTQPSYLEPLFTVPLGIVMLVAAVLLLVVGVIWMSRMVRVEV